MDIIRTGKHSTKGSLCPLCNSPARYYDGCLGYEALKCTAAGCAWEYDLNAPDNVPPASGETEG